MKPILLILSLFLTGCASDQFFYSQNLPDVENPQIPARTFFGPGQIPAVVAAGAGYYGHELRVDMWRLEPDGATLYLGRGKVNHLKTADAFVTWWHPELKRGRYRATLYVDNQPQRYFEIVVEK